MYKSVSALFEPLRLIDYDDIEDDFVALGDIVSVPAIQLWFDNFTNVPVIFSHNGVDDHIVLWSKSSKVSDITANASFTSGAGILCYPAFIQWYVRYYDDAPTSGFVSMQVLYGRDE